MRMLAPEDCRRRMKLKSTALLAWEQLLYEIFIRSKPILPTSVLSTVTMSNLNFLEFLSMHSLIRSRLAVTRSFFTLLLNPTSY